MSVKKRLKKIEMLFLIKGNSYSPREQENKLKTLP